MQQCKAPRTAWQRRLIPSVNIQIQWRDFTMKILMVATCVLMFCFLSPQAWAQNCKPDVSREDKISKERIDIWLQSLFSTGFGSSLMSTSEVDITATVGRYGTINAVNIQIQKREESATNAAFESAYRGAVGKPFYFGFKNGDPVAFVVTSIGNNAKVQQGLFSAKGVTTVVLSAVVQDNELATLRNALTSRQIDAFRIVLSGDVRIEKSVNEKNGKKLMEKFSCFYQSLDKRGIELSAASPQSQLVQPASPSDSSVPGKYVRKDRGSDYIELNPDGTFSLQQDGKGYRGNYKVQADTITIQVPNSWEGKARISGNTMVDSYGRVWEKQAEPQKASSQLTIDQIIQMVAAKLPDDIIIKIIQNSGSKFDLTPEALIKLKTAGVSDAVIRAMTR